MRVTFVMSLHLLSLCLMSLSSVLASPSCILPPHLLQACTCSLLDTGMKLSCRGLNSTSLVLHHMGANSSRGGGLQETVTEIQIADSRLHCVRLEEFSRFPNLTRLGVTRSNLRRLVCGGGKRQSRRRKAVGKLRRLAALDLSHNSLEAVGDQGVSGLEHLRSLNLSNNLLTSANLGPIFASMKGLKVLDLSHNRLTDSIGRDVIESLPDGLQYLDLSYNDWTCSWRLSWLHSWSKRHKGVLRNKDSTTCTIQNTNRQSPLLLVAKYYSDVVLPECPRDCECMFYHFAVPSDRFSSPTYTLLVNCSSIGLERFPRLPHQTTLLDLSYNKLSGSAFDELDVARDNYQEISGLVLSHNELDNLDNKLLKMGLARSFKADNNRLTYIPYDFSKLLQKYKNTEITFGHNPWRCGCNTEINNSNLKDKIRDMDEVTCGEGSEPESIIGKKLVDVNPSVLCPAADDGAQREVFLQLLCALLALMIVIVLAKLVYDYWVYRNRGQLPWIVLKMP